MISKRICVIFRVTSNFGLSTGIQMRPAHTGRPVSIFTCPRMLHNHSGGLQRFRPLFWKDPGPLGFILPLVTQTLFATVPTKRLYWVCFNRIDMEWCNKVDVTNEMVTFPLLASICLCPHSYYFSIGK